MLCHVTPIMLIKTWCYWIKSICFLFLYYSYIDLSIHDCFVYISFFFHLFIILSTIYV